MKLTDLLNEFNVVIDTPKGLTELRSLILGLAVRGKLVPQDSKDEPALELLKKIEAEKKRLYEEGKIRKPKKLKKVSEEKEFFEVPENWVWVKLGHLFNVYTGDSISKRVKEEKYIGVEGQTYLGTKDVNYGFQPINYETEVSIPLNELDDFNTAPKGSVLVCAEGGSAGKKCGYVEKDVCFGNKLICNVPFYKMNTRLLLGYMLTDLFRSQFVESMTGIIGGISQTNYNKLLFPLPPLEEQSRIVNKFEELLEEVRELEAKLNRQTQLVDKLQLAVNAEVQQAPDAEASQSAWNVITSNFDTLYHTPEAIDNLKKNILNEAVRGRLVPQESNDEPAAELLKKIEAEKERLYESGEIRKPKTLPPVNEEVIPFEKPESWEWCRLGEIISFGPRNGFSPRESNKGTGQKCLTLTATTKGFFDPVHFKYFDEQIDEDSYLWIKNGDILIQRGNSRDYVGIAALCKNVQDKFIYPDLMIKIRVGKYLSDEFIHKLIISPNWRKYYQENASGTQKSMPKINQTIVVNTLIPLPPIEEQHRIVQRIEELFIICDRFKAQLLQREKVNERLVKGLVQEVLEQAGNLGEESIPVNKFIADEKVKVC